MDLSFQAWKGQGGGLTVVVVLLEVHVDDTTSDDAGHVVRVELGGLRKLAVLGTVAVAAVLGEEDGDGVVGEEIDDLAVSGLLEGAVAAPLIDVVAPEVNSLLLVTAVEVVGHQVTDAAIVVGGIADTHPAVGGGVDVGLHVADGGLDEGRGIGVGGVVGDLVATEEADDVLVVLHGVDHVGVALVQIEVPRGRGAVDGLRGGRQVGDDIDTGVGQQVHAGVVVGGGVEGVGTDDIGAGGLQDGNVTLAAGAVRQRVEIVDGGVTLGGLGRARIPLVGDTLDVKFGAVLVEETLALHDDGLDVGLGRAEEGGQGKLLGGEHVDVCLPGGKNKCWRVGYVLKIRWSGEDVSLISLGRGPSGACLFCDPKQQTMQKQREREENARCGT